jgi:ADP-ribose pyrophosphatase YjhB (NUDIX family)
MPPHSFKLIASAVARRHGELLLVQQRYPGDQHPYWGLPGGQVEPGEELLVGLGRELLEEPGLPLVRIPTIAFVIQILRQTQEGHQQWLACHFACEVEGLLGPQDPDGLVLSAHWVEEQTALEHLGTDPQYQWEPLRSFLGGEAAPGAVYTIRVTEDPDSDV